MKQSNRFIRTPVSFDDILLVPKNGDVESRHSVNLAMNVGGSTLEFPIIASPMDTVCEAAMADAINTAGGLGIIHRYMPLGKQCKMVYDLHEEGVSVGAAVGASGEFLDDAVQLVGSGASVILVDVANGHSELAVRAVKEIRNHFGKDLHIMAGNVATAEGFNALADAGANSVRVGIGGGHACTTRYVSGHGLPTLASILDCYYFRRYDAAIIADGGIRNTGDMAKAFAAGADAIMLGSMLAGYDESPGEIIYEFGKEPVKQFRGMASREAQEVGRGSVSVVEGISTHVPYRGSVGERIREIRGGLGSACSYSGVRRLADLCKASEYVEVNSIK